VNQTRECPFCSKEIKAERVLCPFCGSDLRDSPVRAQTDNQPKRKWIYNILEWLAVFITAGLIFYLSDHLPEGAGQWYDWFFGRGQLPLYAPVKIITVLIPVCWLVARRLGYLKPSVENRGDLKTVNEKRGIPSNKNN
jgi:hypothetical protein